MIRPAAGYACVLAAALCSGCFSYAPSREELPRTVEAPTNPPVWPEPDVAPLQSVMDATPTLVFRARPKAGTSVSDLKNEDLKSLVQTPEYTVIRNELIGGELIRVFKKPESRWSGWDLYFKGFVPTGDALCPSDVDSNVWRLSRWRAARMRNSINTAWEAHGIEADDVRDQIGLGEGIPFHIPEELPPNCRGIILHLWAMGGNDYETAVVREMTSRGWLVVDIKPTHTAVGDITPDALAKIMVLEQERDSISGVPKIHDGETWAAYTKRLQKSPEYQRQTAISAEVTELRNPVIPLCQESDVSGAAATVAQRIDASFARNSAAVEAILEAARRMHPTLRSKPVVVMGFSAGALSTPTVAARLVRDVAAVVIIGGAANALGVATHSEISTGGIRLKCAGKAPAPELVRALEREYLSRTRMDAYQTAPLLADQPVLVIDAGMDTWVPSEYGQLLYERLGRPDRLHMAMGGHGFLFYFLPRRSAWIADWVASAVERGQHAQARGKNQGIGETKH